MPSIRPLAIFLSQDAATQPTTKRIGSETALNGSRRASCTSGTWPPNGNRRHFQRPLALAHPTGVEALILELIVALCKLSARFAGCATNAGRGS
jgi:hypothetical protein